MGLLRDCAVVGLSGIALGLMANALSPRGLKLTRDYFPSGPQVGRGSLPAVASREGRVPAEPPSSPTPPTSPKPASGVTKRGLPLASHEEVERLFRDPRRAQGLILFVDARSDARYASGHIPGAKQFDHYHPEQGIADILPATQVAEQIVVYCSGGECEDSELVVLDLIALGVPAEKLVVYGGGITEWAARGLPLEKASAQPQAGP